MTWCALLRRSAASLGFGMLLALASVASPASAADEVGLSADGVTWTDELRAPLFDPAERWVPGDRQRQTFYVRNDGPTAAHLRVQVLAADEDALLGDDRLTLTARVGAGAWQELSADTGELTLPRERLDRRGVARVDLLADLDWEASNATMTDALPVDLRIRLSEDTGPGSPAGEPGSGPGSGPGSSPGSGTGDEQQGAVGGVLPSTGADISHLVVWLAAILVGIGSALVLAGRKERRGHA